MGINDRKRSDEAYGAPGGCTVGGTGRQTRTNKFSEEPWIIWTADDVFYLRHFSVSGSKALVVDEVRCATYFCPENFEVCWR